MQRPIVFYGKIIPDHRIQCLFSIIGKCLAIKVFIWYILSIRFDLDDVRTSSDEWELPFLPNPRAGFTAKSRVG